jgi:two-component system LytT family response regulator
MPPANPPARASPFTFMSIDPMEPSLTAFIVDDESDSREVLALMLAEQHPEVRVAGAAASVDEAIPAIAHARPDVVFLDIEMPGGSGFDLVRQLREPLPEIIFCTAYGHYAIRAIECSALAYLLKPVSAPKLASAIEKAKHRTHARHRSLQLDVLEEQLVPGREATRFLINTLEDIKIIRFDDVVCCIAESNYTRLHLADGTRLMVSKTLKEFEGILQRPHFFRIHHSYLINLHFIRRIIKADGYVVELPQELLLDVSRSRREELMQRLAEL